MLAACRTSSGETCREPPLSAVLRRALTLSRELGAGETNFPANLAARLGLHLYDRELLEQEALRLGVTEADLAQVDEHAAGIFQRFRPGNLFRAMPMRWAGS